MYVLPRATIAPMVTTQCIFCKSKQNITELYPATYSEAHLSSRKFSARTYANRIHMRMVRCSNCSLVFSNPILPASQMQLLYRYSACTYDALIPYAGSTYADLIETVLPHLGNKPSLVDVGCGTGFVLSELKKRHKLTKLYGVEPSSVMADMAPKDLRKNITVDIFKPNQFPKNSLDVVSCFHTLDHMRDPLTFINEAYKILKPGGFIVLVVHDVGSWSVKLMGERSPVFDIEHVYLFNTQTITKLLSSVNFKNITSHALSNTYPLWYWLHMSGLPFGLNDKLSTISQKMQFGFTPLSLAAGNMYAIAQKPL